METQTLRVIKALRATLDKKSDEPINSEIYVNGETTNRGNKLKIGSSRLHRGQLNGLNTGPIIKKVKIDGEEREYIQRKRKMRDDLSDQSKKSKTLDNADEDKDDDEDDDDEDDENPDPYSEVDIRKILAPITKPEDAVRNPAILKILQDDSLRNLSSQAIDIIEYEQNNASLLSNLMDLFLGEDPKYLKVENMGLPDYDHELVDGETAEEVKFNKNDPKHKNDYVIESSNDNGSVNNVKTEDYLASLQISNENKRITRKIDSNYQEVDPFFALPQFKIDPDNGVDPELAGEIRQISQITLQRTREYIRTLQKIRTGLIRAERLKDQVYKWCREMNGEYDSEIIAPAPQEKKK